MSLRNTLKPLALFVGAVFAIAPLASFADDLPVKIGFAAPLTGANAGYGKDLENGVRLAIEEANAQKIRIGAKVAQFQIVSEDDQADPRIGVQAAQKLVDAGDPARYDKREVLNRVRRMLGVPGLELDVLAISHWEFEGVVAQRQRQGPVFLVGNAAHRHPPTGGLGLNTAVQDVHNLAWKLAAVLSGQATDPLLDTYDTERRPVGAFNVRHCLANAGGHRRVAVALGLHAGQPEDDGWAGIAEWTAGTPEGAAKRVAVTEAIASNADDYSQLGVELGYHYEAGALVPDGSPAPQGDHVLRDYVPTTRPGHYLPHVTFDRDGVAVSSHHLVEPSGLTLLVDAQFAPQWTEAARGVPGLSVRTVGTDAHGEWAKVRGVDDSGAVLVRPDRHVAWRATDWAPGRAAELADVVNKVYGLDAHERPERATA